VFAFHIFYALLSLKWLNLVIIYFYVTMKENEWQKSNSLTDVQTNTTNIFFHINLSIKTYAER